MNIPEVSVIIPLYNAEKNIVECLETLLAQTLKNFEVIIVDDCSTDSSVAIVESYSSKLGGRLKLSHTNKNSGKPALPRNKGLTLSRGEYVLFIDDDDLLTPTALEELFTLAKTYDADVVHCEKYFSTDASLNAVQLFGNAVKRDFVDKPTWEPYILPERIQKIKQHLFMVMPWLKFVKRDLLIENNIIFPNIVRDDDIWTWQLLFCAEKFLNVPNAVYIWRDTKNSITRRDKTPAEKINFWINPVILGVKPFDEILGNINFFKANPNYRYEMLKIFIEPSFLAIYKPAHQISPHDVYETIKHTFGEQLGEYDALIPLLCTVLNTQDELKWQ